MAEYIDRNKTQAYLYNNMMWYDGEGYMAEDSEKDKALWDLVNGIPTADVIERSKIDKAIEEIQQTLYVDSLIFGELCDFKDGKISADDVIEKFNRVTRKEVLEILKRNIGE